MSLFCSYLWGKLFSLISSDAWKESPMSKPNFWIRSATYLGEWGFYWLPSSQAAVSGSVFSMTWPIINKEANVQTFLLGNPK